MESNYLSIPEPKRRQRRRQGKSNFLYARYADDFIVLCNGTKAQAQEMKEELATVLNNMGLTLSEEKTKITHITEGFTFLGYKVIRNLGISGKMVPKVLIPESAIKRFRHKTREILAPGTTKESVSAKIMAQNRLTAGWCQDYRCTSSPGYAFAHIGTEVYWGMAHWLGRKYKMGIPAVIRKYGKDSTFVKNNYKLLKPGEYKAKKLLTKTWHNPYTGNEAVNRETLLSYDDLWTGKETRVGWRDLREEVIHLKGTTCYVCGTILHPNEVEIDHSTKPRARFKDTMEADRMKHLQPICTSCHRAKTKKDQKVLSRMP